VQPAKLIAFAVPNGQVVYRGYYCLGRGRFIGTRLMMLWSLLLSGNTIEYAGVSLTGVKANGPLSDHRLFVVAVPSLSPRPHVAAPPPRQVSIKVSS
jgi:hypothetical protein